MFSHQVLDLFPILVEIKEIQVNCFVFVVFVSTCFNNIKSVIVQQLVLLCVLTGFIEGSEHQTMPENQKEMTQFSINLIGGLNTVNWLPVAGVILSAEGRNGELLCCSDSGDNVMDDNDSLTLWKT